jgi:hypothetical protein
MSVTWWDDTGRKHTRSFDNCDSDGPWFFTIPSRYAPDPDPDSDSEVKKDLSLTTVIRRGEKHYVVPTAAFQDTDDHEFSESWLKRNYIGMILDPEYPIGPADPLEAYTADLYITGTYRPKSKGRLRFGQSRSWVTGESFF